MNKYIYLAKRVLPFFVLFMLNETLMRLIFLIQEDANISESVFFIAKHFATGLLYDAGVFAYLLVILAFYFLVLPFRKWGSKADKTSSSIIFGLITYILLFKNVSEWFFWDEFEARFNFIAVDYLVYTHEVIGNIVESYPIVPLLTIIAIVSLLSGWLYYKYFFKHSNDLTKFKVKKRLKVVVISVLVATISFFSITSNLVSSCNRRYLDEIAKNGIFELFAAYRHNEIPYKDYYLANEESKVLDFVRASMGKNAVFKDKLLTHHVTASKPEKRYNVVMITVESFSADFMKKFGNTQSITPYLDDLASKSILFTNMYAIGTRTVYGLAALSLSVPPVPGNSIVRRPENENLFTLAEVFNKKGYDSRFLYGGHGYFDNMNYFFANNGYQVVDRAKLKPEEITFANVWGVADEDIFNRAIKENDLSYASGKPFFDMVLTTSNHRPYTYPEGRIDIPSHTGRNGAVKYTDYAINKFLKDAEQKPWFKDTIFVIVADHTAGSARKSELDPDGYHIPFMIYAPKLLKPQEVSTFSSQIDVLPTVLGLLNFNYDSRFYGRDILKDPIERAFISNYQQLGYITPKSLVILKPVKNVQIFSKDNGSYSKLENANPTLVNEAIGYFQGASHWKEWNNAFPDKE